MSADPRVTAFFRHLASGIEQERRDMKGSSRENDPAVLKGCSVEEVVHRWNSHEALVEALDRLLSREKDLWAYDEAKGIGLREDLEFSNSALSAARSPRQP